MSATDISAIPQANTINNQSARQPYRGIIKILPNLVNVLNSINPNLTPELRLAKIARIKAIIDSNMDIISASLGQVQDTDTAYTPIPDTGNIP